MNIAEKCFLFMWKSKLLSVQKNKQNKNNSSNYYAVGRRQKQMQFFNCRHSNCRAKSKRFTWQESNGHLGIRKSLNGVIHF